jgi:hypothetical protein
LIGRIFSDESQNDSVERRKIVKNKALILAAMAFSALASSVYAESFTTDVSSYWGESYTDASGNYQSPVTNTSVNGGALVAPILTDGTQALANEGYPDGGNEVNNYLRTFSNTGPVAAGTHYNGSLLGDLSGKTYVTATFNITNSTYSSGEQFNLSDLVGESNPSPSDQSVAGDPSIRFAFTGANSDVWYSNWNNSVLVTSMDNGDNVTLTVDFDPSNWSDINGTLAADDVATFDASLSNVTRLGLSFSSGSFFSDGFAFNTGGTASLNLDSINTGSGFGSVSVPLPASAKSGLVLLGGLSLLGGVKRFRNRKEMV